MGIIGNPWDFYKLCYLLNKSVVTRWITSHIIKGVIQIIKNQDELVIDDILLEKGIDKQRLFATKYNGIDFMDHILPLLEGISNQEVNQIMKSQDQIQKIRIPVLNIHSMEDYICLREIIPVSDLHYKTNFINLYFERGGHIEFFHGWRPQFYAQEVMLKYFKVMDQMEFLN